MTTANKGEERLVIVIGVAGAVAIFFLLAVSTSDIVNNMEALAQQGRSNIITITGETSGQRVLISEFNHQSEICARLGTVVSGSGVTSLGEASSCPTNAPIGWDISPNPDGIDTRYMVEGNSNLGPGGRVEGAEVDDGRETDNDVYILDANQFAMFDGPGNDRYDLVGVSAQGVESVIYSDTTGGSGRDRVTFTER